MTRTDLFRMDIYEAIIAENNLRSLTTEDLWKFYDEAIKANNEIADVWEDEGNEDYSSQLWYAREAAYHKVTACEVVLEERGL